MAKFNTLAGGYYGKLGATVGQRWKNLRTVRAYVVPHNPQTEVQQANRRRFSDCVFYAQLAGQMNQKVTCFDTVSKTLWNARMSAARGYQDLGYTEMDRIPLYPENFSVPNHIATASISNIIDETHIEVTVTGVTLEEERVLTMLLLLPGSGNWKDRLALCIGSNGDNGGQVFTFRLPEGVTIGDGLKARLVSCDDTDSSVDLIASSQIDLPIAGPAYHEFDTTISSVTRSGNIFTFTFGEDFQNGDNSISVASIKGVVNGAWETISNPTVSLINNSGKFAMTYEVTLADNQDLIAFPVGSEVTISEVKSWSASVHTDASNVTESCDSSDLSRTYKNTVSSVSRNGSTYTFTFARSLPSVSSKSGAFTGQAVVNGAFANIAFTGYTVGADTFVWASGIVASQNLPAFASGSYVKPNITIVGNGVTYTPETSSNQNITNGDLSRTYNNTISSVSRSGNTFTVAMAQAFPTGTQQSGTCSVRAVKSGAFVTETISSVTLSTDSFSFTQTTTKDEDIFAFPNGASITFTKTILGNGVSYSAETATAQSVSNSDLSRNISSAPTVDSSSDFIGLDWSLANATGTAESGVSHSARFAPDLAWETQALSDGSWEVGSNKISFSSGVEKDYAFAPTGSYISVPSKSVTANGVTYTLAAQNVPFDSRSWVPQSQNLSGYGRGGSGWFQYNVDGLDTSNMIDCDSVTGDLYDGNIDISDEDSEVYTVTRTGSDDAQWDSLEQLINITANYSPEPDGSQVYTMQDDSMWLWNFEIGGVTFRVQTPLAGMADFEWQD